MRSFKTINYLQQALHHARSRQLTTGFVPTMGALHEGHISLIKNAKAHTGFTVCSIFVNPTQFNDPKDLEKYPRTIEKDVENLEAAGCDAVFIPAVSEIYNYNDVEKIYALGTVETLWEGAFRPGHFQGVAQVLDKLFTIVQPNAVFFGQKDYQQCMVVKKLLQLEPAFDNIKMHVVPTLREADGLAMSSRNARLLPADRQKATAIYKALQYIQGSLQPGAVNFLEKNAQQMLAAQGFTIDYIAIADAATLAPVTVWDGRQKLVAIAAAFIGGVRLIDNLPLN